MSGPMTGVKVVELGVWVAGPATGGCRLWKYPDSTASPTGAPTW